MSKATAKQKQWMQDISELIQEFGFMELYGEEFCNYNFELHHVLGRSAKHNKVPIGHWFIIPVPTHLHNVMSNNPINVTHFKNRFTEKYGNQREIFSTLCDMLRDHGVEMPPNEVLNQIMDTNS